MSQEFDVIIIGGGAAGLSAALILGRCRRKVLVLDNQKQRNLASQSMHGFSTRDGMPPKEYFALARKELENYKTVSYRKSTAQKLERINDRFKVSVDEDLGAVVARRVLIATGVIDKVPEVKGINQLYGQSVFHCPYCDGYEWRDKRIAAYGSSFTGLKLALSLLVWTNDIILCSNGPAELTADEREIAIRHGIEVYEQPIARMQGKDGFLEAIHFTDDSETPCDALFFSNGTFERLALAEVIGCNFNEGGCIETKLHQVTTVEGLFAAGDVTRDIQFVIVAAAQGAQAATGINLSLLEEDLRQAGSELKLTSSD